LHFCGYERFIPESIKPAAQSLDAPPVSSAQSTRAFGPHYDEPDRLETLRC
jgi:hypothetical protein